MLGVLTGFAVIGVVIAVGYVLGRWQIAGPHAETALNRIAFFVASPALLMTVLARADIHAVFSGFLIVSMLSCLVAAALSIVISRVFLRSTAADTVLGAASAGYVNTNNIGLPIAIYVIGDAQYVAPVMLFQLVVIAPLLVGALDVTSRGRVSARSILLQPVRNPVILGSLGGLAIALFHVPIPDIVMAPLDLLGQAGIPLILLAFGMSLNGSRLLAAESPRAAIVTASVIKAVVMPGCAFLLARYVFHLPSIEVTAASVIAALPTAQKIYGYAARYERGTVLVRDVVLITTMAAVPVIIVLALLLHPGR